jgi:succinoglycan biosynthesis transport protein ExoP
LGVRPHFWARLGLRRSAPITSVLSIWARAAPRFIDTVDLPSPGTVLVTTMILAGSSRPLSTTPVRTVRTGVVLSGLDDPAKIIVVTSTVPGEGKSTVSMNLGAALAQMESTLVIGADLRRPSLAQKCGLTPNHAGLTHFVSGSAKLDDCIEHLPELNLYVMPAGIIPPNPLEMISSKKFVQALQFLKGRFDRIVIDSAPVNAVSDALVLASNADSVIYVVKADSTSATQAQKGIASIVGSNEPLTGVVLNQFDAKKAGNHYGKYYQYGNYYQSDEPAKA